MKWRQCPIDVFPAGLFVPLTPLLPHPPRNSPLPAVISVTKHSDLFSPQQGGLCLVKSVHIYDRYAYIIHIERNLYGVSIRGQKIVSN